MQRARVGCVALALTAAALFACEEEFPGSMPLAPTSLPGSCGRAFDPAEPTGMPVGNVGLAGAEKIGPLVEAEMPPPPISGGTLALSADGSTLIAADPDRDAIYLVDVASRTLKRVLPLQAADEPGRIVQDQAGRVHVALRGGGAIASFELNGDAAPRRSEVCELPRGLAYDRARDRLFVACSEGLLVQVNPTTGVAERKVELGRDLRDVVVAHGRLLVSSFRSSEVASLDPESGLVTIRRKPPTSVREQKVLSDLVNPQFGGCTPPVIQRTESSPHVAWRTIEMSDDAIMVAHQRATNSEVLASAGGYGIGDGCGPGIVRSAITVMFDGRQFSFDLSYPGVFVDLAYDPTSDLIALANPAGSATQSNVVLFDNPLRVFDPRGGQPNTAPCHRARKAFHTAGQVTAVTFVTPTLVAAQAREPAAIFFLEVHQGSVDRLELGQPTRYDAGHALFHQIAFSGLACASCHPEAGDDGHVWRFTGFGPRRTQNLRGGILGTEPFHWNGGLLDFPALVQEEFVSRMRGPQPSAGHTAALARWIDRQPALRATPKDPAAAERGRQLFESDAVGCAKCHGGMRFTNNQTEDVGTGVRLQTPALTGLSFRAPFMHDGCASLLRERFTVCGGGDRHGRTSQLSATQLDDLTAYLETL